MPGGGKLGFDLGTVLRHIENDLGPVQSVEALAEGEESRAFAFTTAGGEYVARLNAERSGFDKDAWAFEHASGLPVPEVVSITLLDDGNTLCISRRARGGTLQALRQGGAYAYGPAVGRLLDGLAGSDVSAIAGFGRFDPHGNARHACWRDHLTEPQHYDWSLLPDRWSGRVNRLLDALMTDAGTAPDCRHLVHGDFGSNNVLCADGRITGLIDWSEAMVGDPLFDVANLLFWRSWLDCMEEQCRYMEEAEPWRLQDDARLRTYRVRIGLETLHGALAADDRPTAQWALQQSLAATE